MSDSNPVSIPIDPNQILSNEMCPSSEADKKTMQDIPYQEAVGSLLYAAQKA